MESEGVGIDDQKLTEGSMIDFKEARQCKRERERNMKDFFTTFLMVAAVLSLFAAAAWELTREGGALDHALGVTAQEIQSASK